MRNVNPEMGSLVLAEAFVVTVIGGMGSLVGAVVAGLLVGVAVSMTALFAPEMATIVMFALMALVLLVRPQGLFGKLASAHDRSTLRRRRPSSPLRQLGPARLRPRCHAGGVARAALDPGACACCPGCCRPRRWR